MIRRILPLSLLVIGSYIMYTMLIAATPPSHLILDGMGVSSPNYTANQVTAKKDMPFPSVPAHIQFPITYYRFGKNPTLQKELDDCSNNILKLWNEHKSKGLPAGSFNSYWKGQDVFCWKAAEKLSPTMYFDFRGEANRPYFLDSVQVEIVDFLYAKNAGGYINNKVSKDVLLQMQKGLVLNLNMSNPKLQFKGTGRVEYTFWSDHYSIISAGRYPSKAVYLLGIRFHFSDDHQAKIPVPSQGFHYFIIHV